MVDTRNNDKGRERNFRSRPFCTQSRFSFSRSSSMSAARFSVPLVVSSILGHYSAGFTLDTYTHTTLAMQQAADKVGSFIAQAV